MCKWVFILSIVVLVGCNERTLYDNPVIIIEKAYSEQEDFTYKYTVEMVFMVKHSVFGEGNYKTFWFHTNHNWDIGDTIWIGARWGKHYEQTEE